MKLYRKFNPTLLHWATAFFSNGLRKYAIWVYVTNNWKLPFCSEFHPGCWNVIVNSIRLFSNGLRAFFKMVWRISEEKLPDFFLYILCMVQHIHLNIGTVTRPYASVSPSFRQSASPPVCQSASPPVIGICNPFLNRPTFWACMYMERLG